VTGWTRRARLAARRAQRLARTGAVRVQRAAGDLADKLRHRGRQAAVKDIDVMEMAGLEDVGWNGGLLKRSVEATLNRSQNRKLTGEARKPGPLPDPAWTAGYRDVAVAKVPGFARQPAAAAAPAGAEAAEAGEPRPAWPEMPAESTWPFEQPEASDDDQADMEAGR
jgi:hypothetical protein